MTNCRTLVLHLLAIVRLQIGVLALEIYSGAVADWSLIPYEADKYEGHEGLTAFSFQVNRTEDLTEAVRLRLVLDNLGREKNLADFEDFSLESDRLSHIRVWSKTGSERHQAPQVRGEIAAIPAGKFHGLALTSDGKVVTWGSSDDEPLQVPRGISDVVVVSAGFWHSLALQKDGTVVAWGDGDHGRLEVPEGLRYVTDVSAGNIVSLALQKDGTVVAWGDDDYGQLQVPEGLTGIVAISAGRWHNLALTREGTVIAWGLKVFHQLQVPEGLSDVKAIPAGEGFSLALKQDGTVVAWGRNDFGQLQVPEGLSDVIAILAGKRHSLALKSDRTVIIWGDADFEQWDQGFEVPNNVAAISAGLDFNLFVEIQSGDGQIVSLEAGEKTKSLIVNVKGDLQIEPDELFFVALHQVIEGETKRSGEILAKAQGIIRNDDTLLPSRPISVSLNSDGFMIIEYSGSLYASKSVTERFVPVAAANSPFLVSPDRDSMFFISR